MAASSQWQKIYSITSRGDFFLQLLELVCQILLTLWVYRNDKKDSLRAKSYWKKVKVSKLKRGKQDSARDSK